MKILVGILIVVLLVALLVVLVYVPRLRSTRTGHDSGGPDDTTDGRGNGGTGNGDRTG